MKAPHLDEHPRRPGDVPGAHGPARRRGAGRLEVHLEHCWALAATSAAARGPAATAPPRHGRWALAAASAAAARRCVADKVAQGLPRQAGSVLLRLAPGLLDVGHGVLGRLERSPNGGSAAVKSFARGAHAQRPEMPPKVARRAAIFGDR